VQREMAARALSLFELEKKVRLETLAEATLETERKLARVGAFGVKIKSLKAETASDEAKVEAFKLQELVLEAAEKDAIAGATRVAAALDADDSAIAKMGIVRDSYLGSLQHAADHELATTEPKALLIARSNELAAIQRAAAAQCSAEVAGQRRAHEAREKEAAEKRVDELCAMRAERKAIEYAIERRAEHTTEVEAQRAGEAKDAKTAQHEIRHMEAGIRLLDSVITRAALQMSDATEDEKDAKSRQKLASEAFDNTCAASKQRLANMALLVNSEAEVTKRQQEYVNKLHSQLKTTEVVSEADPYSPSRPSRASRPSSPRKEEPTDDAPPDAPTSSSLSNAFSFFLTKSVPSTEAGITSPAKTSSEKGPFEQEPLIDTKAPGKIGQALLREQETATKEWAAELQRQLDETVAELTSEREALEVAEKLAESEKKRLMVQRAAQVKLLTKMEAYEDVLGAKSPRAAAESPRRTSRKSHEPSGNSVSRNLEKDLGSPKAPRSPSPVREEAVAAQKKYLHEQEERADKQDAGAKTAAASAEKPPSDKPAPEPEPEITSQTLGPDNDEDPRLNPDVKPRWRSGGGVSKPVATAKGVKVTTL